MGNGSKLLGQILKQSHTSHYLFPRVGGLGMFLHPVGGITLNPKLSNLNPKPSTAGFLLLHSRV